MDESRLLDEISRIFDGNGDRAQKAAGIAKAIRRAGGYRWVGIYEVTEEEVANVAFEGPGAPTHPRFPMTHGLSGAAIASKETVVVGDVRRDPRYLTAFGSTRSEIVVPVADRADERSWVPSTSRASKRKPSSEMDQSALERCAAAITQLFE